MIMKRQLYRREKVMLVVCLIAVGVWGFVQSVVRPSRERQDTVDQKIVVSQRRLEKNQRIIKTAKDVDQQFAAIFKALGQTGSDDTERSAMLLTIQEIADQTSVNISNMQPQKALSKEFYKEFSVQLMVDGQWESVIQFLHHLQDQPNYFDIDEINLEKNSINNASMRGRLILSRVRVQAL